MCWFPRYGTGPVDRLSVLLSWPIFGQSLFLLGSHFGAKIWAWLSGAGEYGSPYQFDWRFRRTNFAVFSRFTSVSNPR